MYFLEYHKKASILPNSGEVSKPTCQSVSGISKYQQAFYKVEKTEERRKVHTLLNELRRLFTAFKVRGNTVGLRKSVNSLLRHHSLITDVQIQLFAIRQVNISGF